MFAAPEARTLAELKRQGSGAGKRGSGSFTLGALDSSSIDVYRGTDAVILVFDVTKVFIVACGLLWVAVSCFCVVLWIV